MMNRLPIIYFSIFSHHVQMIIYMAKKQHYKYSIVPCNVYDCQINITALMSTLKLDITKLCLSLFK